ncbi:MAG: NAD-dependent epimerase/dehydratase family protein [Bdellovibrionota bacterium]
MLNDRETFHYLNLGIEQTAAAICDGQATTLRVHASSAATYGAMESGFSDNEDLIPSLVPLNPYGESKQQFDLWVLEQTHLQKTPPVWSGFAFSMFTVWGTAQRKNGECLSARL